MWSLSQAVVKVKVQEKSAIKARSLVKFESMSRTRKEAQVLSLGVSTTVND